MKQKIFILFVILFFFNCTNKDNPRGIGLAMTNDQKAFLEKQRENSFDLNASFDESEVFKIVQKESVQDISNIDYVTSRVILNLYEDIKTPSVKETDSFYYIYNTVLSPVGKNIAIYSKEGILIDAIGRKGMGPSEVNSIGAISEIDSVTMIFDNGYLKRIGAHLQEIDRKFLMLWVNDVIVTESTYDVRLSDNEVFPFPITVLDKETDSVKITIKDSRPGALSFSSANGTTFFSNDDLIVYAKTTLKYLHFIPKKDLKETIHYSIEAEIFRENKEKFDKKNSSRESFYQFMNTLFLIDRIHIYENNVWISFIDRNETGGRYFLGKIDLREIGSGDLNIELIETTRHFKKVEFFNDHLFFSKLNKDQSQLLVNKVYLDSL